MRGARRLGRSMKNRAQTPNMHRADEPGLKGPEQILPTRAEKQQRDRDHRRNDRTDTVPHQCVGTRDGAEVEDDDLGEVREIRVKPDDAEGRAIQQQRKGRPVLIHRA